MVEETMQSLDQAHELTHMGRELTSVCPSEILPLDLSDLFNSMGTDTIAHLEMNSTTEATDVHWGCGKLIHEFCFEPIKVEFVQNQEATLGLKVLLIH